MTTSTRTLSDELVKRPHHSWLPSLGKSRSTRVRDGSWNLKTSFKKQTPKEINPPIVAKKEASINPENLTLKPTPHWDTSDLLYPVSEKIEADIEALEAEQTPAFLAGEDEARNRIEALLAGYQNSHTSVKSPPPPPVRFGVYKQSDSTLWPKDVRSLSFECGSWDNKERHAWHSPSSRSLKLPQYYAGNGVHSSSREEFGLPITRPSSQTTRPSNELHRLQSPGIQLRTKTSRGSMISVKSQVSVSYRSALGHSRRVQHRSLSELEFNEHGIEVRQSGAWKPDPDDQSLSSDNESRESLRLKSDVLSQPGSALRDGFWANSGLSHRRSRSSQSGAPGKRPHIFTPNASAVTSPQPSPLLVKALQDLNLTRNPSPEIHKESDGLNGEEIASELLPDSARDQRSVLPRHFPIETDTMNSGPRRKGKNSFLAGRVRLSTSCPELTKDSGKKDFPRSHAGPAADRPQLDNTISGAAWNDIVEGHGRFQELTTLFNKSSKTSLEVTSGFDPRVTHLENGLVQLKWRCVSIINSVTV